MHIFFILSVVNNLLYSNFIKIENKIVKNSLQSNCIVRKNCFIRVF